MNDLTTDQIIKIQDQLIANQKKQIEAQRSIIDNLKRQLNFFKAYYDSFR